MNPALQPSVTSVLNIIGPVGIGKTSVAYAVSNVFQYDYARVLPHAVIDLDDVRRAYPAPKSDPFNEALGFKNLASVWSNYKEAGARCLIIPSVMESQKHLDAIRSAVPGADLLVVRLDAPLEVNHTRIRDRETTPESLEWHLNRATQLHRELASKQLEDILINTAGKQPRQIAQEIIIQWGILERFNV